jgi:DNA-binding MarR family transcriptional regulator
MMYDGPTEIELERLIRGSSGAPCPMQARVLHFLAEFLDDAPSGIMPNLAEAARRLETPRQVVSAAIRALEKKGFIVIRRQVEPVVIARNRIRRTVTLRLPQQAQLALPFCGGDGGIGGEPGFAC